MTLDIKSTAEDYAALFELNVGDVVKILDYETVMERIAELCPTGCTFEVTPITPGTQLYTTYGCDHCIITEKKGVFPSDEEGATENTKNNTETEDTSASSEVSEETT